jgi:hypothetical protein
MTNKQKVKESLVLVKESLMSAFEEVLELDELTIDEIEAFCKATNISKYDWCLIVNKCFYEINQKIVEKVKGMK